MKNLSILKYLCILLFVLFVFGKNGYIQSTDISFNILGSYRNRVKCATFGIADNDCLIVVCAGASLDSMAGKLIGLGLLVK